MNNKKNEHFVLKNLPRSSIFNNIYLELNIINQESFNGEETAITR